MKFRRPFMHTINKELFLSVLTILSLIIFVSLYTYLHFADDLISKESIMTKNNTGVILFDRHDQPFFTFYQAKLKTVIPLSEIPDHMKHAIIASEDKDYYKHSGYSLPSIIRAFFSNLINKDALYGGSTITQQLVKNALLNSKKNYVRKLQEVILAQEIERRYSKDEILEMYLNSVYFGEGAFGIEKAAQIYFNKPARSLTLAEASFLTAVLPSPSRLSPFTGGIQQAKHRQHIVLQKMVEQKYITTVEQKEAEETRLAFRQSESHINSHASHFALMVLDQLIKEYGEEYVSRAGFRVKTTLDLTWQAIAEKTVADQVKKLQQNNVTNGAAVVMDPATGDIKALVGSRNWFDEENGKINMAIAPRSVGSSFKPIVYAAAFEKRLITAASVLHDQPTSFPGGYKPVNYDRSFRGPVLVRRALANSLNVPAVEVMQKVGLHDALEMANRLGIATLTDPSNYGLSLVLGTGEVKLIELTGVYAVFANQGVRVAPRTILEITDKHNKNILLSSVASQRVLEPEVAFLITSILSDNKSRAEVFADLLTISRPAAVKTGTTENYRDALTVGYTPDLAIGVWVGNNDNKPMDSVAGSLGAAPIWKNLMEQFLAGQPEEVFKPPAGITLLPVCRNNGVLLAYANQLIPSQTEYFIKGTQPELHCSPRRPSPRQRWFFSGERNNVWRQREMIGSGDIWFPN